MDIVNAILNWLVGIGVLGFILWLGYGLVLNEVVEARKRNSAANASRILATARNASVNNGSTEVKIETGTDGMTRVSIRATYQASQNQINGIHHSALPPSNK